MPTIQLYSPSTDVGGAVQRPAGAEGGFTFMTTLAFSINFAMGAGFLTLPYAL